MKKFKNKLQQTKSSPKQDLKFGLILIIIIVVFLFGCLSFIFIHYVSPVFTISNSIKKAELNNPAKKLADMVIPFAQTYNLEKIYEYNGAVTGLSDNGTPFYTYIFQGNVTAHELHDVIKQYMQNQGYTVQDTSYNQNPSGIPIEKNNVNQSYWQLSGVNSMKDKVNIIITDNNYTNPDTGEVHTIQLGKSVIVVTFYSH